MSYKLVDWIHMQNKLWSRIKVLRQRHTVAVKNETVISSVFEENMERLEGIVNVDIEALLMWTFGQKWYGGPTIMRDERKP